MPKGVKQDELDLRVLIILSTSHIKFRTKKQSLYQINIKREKRGTRVNGLRILKITIKTSRHRTKINSFYQNKINFS